MITRFIFGEQKSDTPVCVVDYNPDEQSIDVTCVDLALANLVTDAFTEKRSFFISVGSKLSDIDRGEDVDAQGVDSLYYMNAVACEIWQRDLRLYIKAVKEISDEQ